MCSALTHVSKTILLLIHHQMMNSLLDMGDLNNEQFRQDLDPHVTCTLVGDPHK